MTYEKETRKWFVTQTYINCKGEVSVSYLSYINNWQVGLHWNGEFKNRDMLFYDSREEALKHRINDDCSIHGLLLKESELSKFVNLTA